MATADSRRARSRRRPACHLRVDRLESRQLLAGDLAGHLDPPDVTAAATDDTPAPAAEVMSLGAGSSLITNGFDPPDLQSTAVLSLDNQTQTSATLASTVVTMTGKSELWITGTTNPVTGSTFHLNSEDIPPRRWVSNGLQSGCRSAEL